MNEEYSFQQEYPIQIRFNDIDPMGHVNNAIMQEYFDIGRLYYLNLMFDKKIEHNGLTLFIASIQTDFLSPIQLEDSIKVQTKVYELGNKSLKMVQRLISEKGNIKAFSKSVMVCVSSATNESQVIPDSWRSIINQMEGNSNC